MNTDSPVTFSRQGDIGIVRFDRGRSGNALDQQSILALTQIATELREDCDLRAIVLTGTDQLFSYGVDLTENLKREKGPGADMRMRRRYERGVRLCQAWQDLPQITVAAIEGGAVGGGVALPLALDWRVMADDAWLLVPEVRVGMNLQWGALPRLVALVGPARAKTICILCERMQAQQALEWGLADKLAPSGQAVEVAVHMALAAAAMPANAAQMVKQGANAAAGALYQAVSYADFDQCQLADASEESRNARKAMADQLGGKKR